MRNEAASVPDLYRELTAALDGFERPYEIVAIDDGSTDETFRLLAGLQRTSYRSSLSSFMTPATLATRPSGARGSSGIGLSTSAFVNPGETSPAVARTVHHDGPRDPPWATGRCTEGPPGRGGVAAPALPSREGAGMADAAAGPPGGRLLPTAARTAGSSSATSCRMPSRRPAGSRWLEGRSGAVRELADSVVAG